MVGELCVRTIEKLTAWLTEDDAKSRTIRAERLRDLLDIFPEPSAGLSFFGGEASVICFGEVRRCYLDGSNVAVVLLCLAYVERELAANLYADGWDRAKSAPLTAVLEEAHERGMISTPDWQTYRELGDLRNSNAHFRAPASSTSLTVRSVEEDARCREILASDAKRALQAMARIVKRQSGRRITLGPSYHN